MAIRIITDSGSDILAEEAARLDITVVPLTVSFGEDQYEDGVELSHHEFYEKLIESDVLPITSQISPSRYEEAIGKVLEPGDTAIVIALSSALSGTYQSACIAAQEWPNRVLVVDTLNVCIGEHILVKRACEMRDLGMSPEDIVAALEEEKKHVVVLAMLDTLEYLKKGGRISKSVAFAGELLSIKPVVTLDKEGKVEMIGKARGSRNAGNLLRELIGKVGGIDFAKPYYLAYSGLSDHALIKYIADHEELWRHETDLLPVTTVGCTIGTHVGPGVIAVAFMEKGLSH